MEIKYFICPNYYSGSRNLDDLKHIMGNNCFFAFYKDDDTRFGVIPQGEVNNYIFKKEEDARNKIVNLGYVYKIYPCTIIGQQ